jgi:hypothetical protein
MTAHVLIISDRIEIGPDLFDAVRARAERSACTFRYIVTNPARAEFHFVHAERHKAVEAARGAVDGIVRELQRQTGSPVTGQVSIRHDPFDAIEEEHLSLPADEVIVAVHDSDFARRVHHDLPHRLAHLKVPFTVVSDRAAQPT